MSRSLDLVLGFFSLGFTFVAFGVVVAAVRSFTE